MDNQLDIKLKLQLGQGIFVEGYGVIEPLLTDDVVRYGYNDYVQLLNIFNTDFKEVAINYMSSSEDLEGVDLSKEFENYNSFDFMLLMQDEEFFNSLEQACNLFLKGVSTIDTTKNTIFIEKENETLEVNRNNFNSICEVIQLQNYIKQITTMEDTESIDEETRKFKEKLEQYRKDVEKYKSKENDEEEKETTFYELLSAISSFSYSINELNIGQLTIYQIYSKYRRLENIQQYDLSIKSIMAGSQNTKVQHWSSNID